VLAVTQFWSSVACAKLILPRAKIQLIGLRRPALTMQRISRVPTSSGIVCPLLVPSHANLNDVYWAQSRRTARGAIAAVADLQVVKLTAREWRAGQLCYRLDHMGICHLPVIGKYLRCYQRSTSLLSRFKFPVIFLGNSVEKRRHTARSMRSNSLNRPRKWIFSLLIP
jgi:hypothetical protein